MDIETSFSQEHSHNDTNGVCPMDVDTDTVVKKVESFCEKLSRELTIE